MPQATTWVIAGGVRVPQDLSVVGFDGIEFGEFVTPALTTIAQPRHELGRSGARLLLTALAGGRPQGRVRLDAPLLRRGSSGPVPPES
jgi:LacI family repressor for deo operon, udp, cdd, tsx, nupC, and nupG